ncbi:molybdate ABC transporter substrate-binding protein [Halobacillus naozhouensis]|uniref:Molybdate ABC transporter substrate-binding protein n=1 Tax=Halobacillus naozhouensis TaxID=554880 RepID=A0ABY8J0D4_9BACI|nr:molybdate ABC transporter substrate-binding protein [Halobacillus naozhouensis]WFT74904.1 molybdate ABC transporter substrate-binding protein [Halobacillus naozhouensis]
MQRKLIILFLGLVLALFAGCSNTPGQEQDTTELTISAASSLTDAMKEIKTTYESQNKDVTLTFNFAGSGKLAQQIQQGAPLDVFLSANQKWMDKLEKQQFILKETRFSFTGNSLVLITKQNRHFDFSSIQSIQLSDEEQLALGDPASVPGGMYTKQALQSINKWEDLKAQMVYARDVRQVLTYVESGNVALGFVYASDALISDRVKIISQVDQSLHQSIIYPAAVLTASANTKEAKAFLDYLKTEEAQEILESYGFEKKQP